MSFTDVPDGSWFKPAVLGLVTDGFIDGTQKLFRPGANATRAEFLKLALAIDKTTPGTPPLIASFDDVKKTAWYFPHLEEAAKQGWIRGDGDCYGTHPCRAYPENAITRGEAAALLVRIFVFERTKNTDHGFIDVGKSDWYAYAMAAMADYCLMNRDSETLRIRPLDPMNRAEMAALMQRTRFVLKGESACGSVSH